MSVKLQHVMPAGCAVASSDHDCSSVRYLPSPPLHCFLLARLFSCSLGAATKKAADVRLDGVIDYGTWCPGCVEPTDVSNRGYYFMNSPGNDLESIAGQVCAHV